MRPLSVSRAYALALSALLPAAVPALAVDLVDVQPAALDQPQINATIFVGDSTTPLVSSTIGIDPSTLELTTVNTFTFTGYFDTGASGILISTPTATAFGVPLTSTIYSDVGVAGSDNFQVSQPVRLALANYYPRTDLDLFSDPAQTQPITAPYVPLPSPYTSTRVQVGPYTPTVDNPITDEYSQLIDELGSLNVIGMPAMKGRVVVMDPTRVNNFDQILNLDINNLTDIPDVAMRTYSYAPGTAFNAATQDTNPGIPTTSHHVKLSYGSFNRFTSLSGGTDAPALEHNPFIGKDPVALLEGDTQPSAPPGIKITRNSSNGLKTSEGNWLLDTGAAASIISLQQAANLGVTYKPGTFKNADPAVVPVLVDENGADLPNQFTLTLGGIGGTTTLAGFFLDSLLVRTMEGSASNDLDPNNLRFLGAPVLVGDITVKDPLTGQTLTLDGIFGMNFLVASANFTMDSSGLVPNITDIASNYFDWITFDEPNGILGLNLAGTSVPEPAAIGVMAPALLLLARRRRR